jgi:hypothetical protein
VFTVVDGARWAENRSELLFFSSDR